MPFETSVIGAKSKDPESARSLMAHQGVLAGCVESIPGA
jgi:hypothetical protein